MEDMEEDEEEMGMEKKENKLRLNMRSRRINSYKHVELKQGTIISTDD